jgi:hypothetical protein
MVVVGMGFFYCRLHGGVGESALCRKRVNGQFVVPAGGQVRVPTLRSLFSCS